MRERFSAGFSGAAETAVKRRGAEPVWPARERCDSDALHLKG